MTNSPDLWAILKALASTKDGAQPVFGIVENITVGTPSAITADNYEAAVSILNDYASAGAIGSQLEQMQDKSARRGKSGKAKPTWVFFRMLPFQPRANGLSGTMRSSRGE